MGRYLEIAERALQGFGSIPAERQGYDINDRNDQRSESANRSPTAATAEPLLLSTCADCGAIDDGSTSVVIELARPDQPWWHSCCYSAVFLDEADCAA
jgi:hypothetical protein